MAALGDPEDVHVDFMRHQHPSLPVRVAKAYSPPFSVVDPRPPPSVAAYLTKWRGRRLWGRPPKVFWVALWALIGNLVALSIIGAISTYGLEKEGYRILLAFNGASGAIVFGLPALEAAQPRNMLGGHFLSALTAIVVGYAMPQPHLFWLAGAVSVAVSVALMELTGTINPPGGAIALMYHTVPAVRALQWNLLWIVELDAAIFVATGLLINNAGRFHAYPQAWL